jgi:Mrp family chromosome partitioning ATPase/intein/homing endonuclease
LIDKNSVVNSLRGVLDPEIGISIVDLKMVRGISIEGSHVKVTIALTVAHCPLAKTLQTDVEKALKKSDEIKSVTVETTAMSKTELNELRTSLQNRAAQPQPEQANTPGPGINRLGKRELRNIVAVASGKGGVGKSFVTSMLAVQLRRLGYEVGILDADLTGPSIAKIFGLKDRPSKSPTGRITPVLTRTGIKVMSINLVLDDPEMPVIWRGPIVNSVIRQLYWDVDWGPLHYLLVDLPPGCIATGSKVYANSHPVSVEQVERGDLVYSVDANIESTERLSTLRATVSPKRVMEVIPQGEAEVFELRTKTRTVQATFNHPILALEKSRAENRRANTYSLGWRPLTELKPGDIVAVVKKLPRTSAAPFNLPVGEGYSSGGVLLPRLTSDDFCRIIGYYLGDGFLRVNPATRTHQVMFAEPNNGRYRQKYVALLEKMFPGARVYQDRNQFGILSRKVTSFFERLGLAGHALEKRVPSWIFGLPESQVLAFIEGFCDADGHRRASKRGFRRPGWMVFESMNMGLMEDARALAISVGMRVTNLYSRRRTLKPPSGKIYSRTSWVFECNRSSRSNRYGAGLIRGRGRQAVGRGLINDHIGFERVVSITSAGRRQVYDLTIEGQENFVVDGIIVHNTSDAPLTVLQSLPLDGVIVVSSPQELASLIVTKAVNMAKKMNAELLGLVENMSYLICPHCGETINVFGEPQGEKLAKQLGIPFLGSVPVDPVIARLSDHGQIEDYTTPVFQMVADELRVRTSQQVQQLMQGLPIAWSIQPSES